MESRHFEIEMCGLSKRKEVPRRRNHDAFAVMPEAGVMGVFDGIGSSRASELISRFSARSLRTRPVRDLFDKNTSGKEVGAALCSVMLTVQSRIHDVYGDLYGSEDETGGTTAEVIKQWTRADGVPMVSVAHIGDSRSYLRREGALHRLTLDHNLPMDNFSHYFGKEHLEKFQRLLDEGTELDMRRFAEQELKCGFAEFISMVKCEASNIVTRCLLNHRNRYVIPDTVHIELEPDDEIYLMTDGISSNLYELQMEIFLHSVESLRARIQRLISEARKVARCKANPPASPCYRRTGRDDMTVAAMKITEQAIGRSSLSV